MDKNKILEILIIFSVLLLSLFILWPYISALIFAAILAYLSYPIYTKIKEKTSERFAGGSLVIGLLLIVILSIVRGINILIRELRRIYDLIPEITETLSYIESFNMGGIEITKEISQYIFSKSIGYFTEITLRIPHIFLVLFIFFISYFYFMKDGEKIYNYVKEKMPFEKNKRDRIIEKIRKNVYAFIYVEVVIGIIQGFVGGIVFYLFGHPYPLMAGIIIGILGIIPVIGPSLVYWPVGLYEILLKQNYVLGAAYIAVGICVISALDYFLRPHITAKKASVHPLIILLGILGGIYAFGAVGIIIGPVLLSISVILLEEVKK